MYGKKSSYLWRSDKLYLVAAFCCSIILLVIWYLVFIEYFKYWFSFSGIVALLISFGPLALIAYLLYKSYDRKSNNFYRGRKGEGAIWYELIKLSDEYCLFQDVKIGERGNIDFIVLGPTGLFAIEVKSHAGYVSFKDGELTLNNRPADKDFLKQAMAEALNTHNYLQYSLNEDIFVNPVIVFSNRRARMHFMLEPVRNVFVVQKRFLRRLLLSKPISKPTIFTPDKVSIIEGELKKLIVDNNNQSLVK